jgi:phosphatidylserine/phosphatidylglycerophosphate/cardiolipin synthase-like enzyme
MRNYSFVTRRQYFAELVEMTSRATAGERIAVAAMDIDVDDRPIAELLDALQAAAHRGAKVLLIVDAMNFLMDQYYVPGPYFYHPTPDARLYGKYKRTKQALERVKSAGGAFHITNTPRRRFNIPQVGRSHIKGAVIGDTAYIGGCNLLRADHIDIMVKLNDKDVADTLHNWFSTMATRQAVREAFSDVDLAISIDSTTQLLLDAGVPGQSIIYETALRLIDNASERLFVTCQYFPGGQTARHLAAAQSRGVRVEIIYGHPRHQGPLSPLHHAHQLAKRAQGLPANFFAGRLGRQAPKLHAKVLVSENEALVGSHNYVIQGVQLGTAEIALHVNDPGFADATRSFMREQLSVLTQ